MATNRERLEEARIIKSDAELTPQQEEAIASLTEAEVDALISAKQKLLDQISVEEAFTPITHHH